MTTILDLERLEFSLVTKALVGKLKPEDAEKAKELGLKLMDLYHDDLRRKFEASQHAIDKATEDTQEGKAP